MSIDLKNAEQLEKMRAAGELSAKTLEMITPHVKVGVTTNQLNQLCHDYIVDTCQAIPSSLGYKGYPKSICTSVNHVVCHGIPNDKPLKPGDILNIDLTLLKNGYNGDTSKMFILGEGSPLAQRLVRVTQECLYAGIKAVRPGAHVGDIGAVIQNIAHKHHFSVVRDFCGHGLGKTLHEPPQILHVGKHGTGVEIVPGMTFTIEPMINAGRYAIKILQDGWTAITKDRRLSAQWEHTLAVTEEKVEVLTMRSEEREQLEPLLWKAS